MVYVLIYKYNKEQCKNINKELLFLQNGNGEKNKRIEMFYYENNYYKCTFNVHP